MGAFMRETFIEVSGKTEDDAISKALTQIGLDRDEVSVEIARRAKPGILGIGGSPAVVKVTYMTDEPVPLAEAEPASEPKKPAKTKEAPAQAASVSTAKPTAAGRTAEQATQFLAGLLDKMGIAATPEVREESAGTLYIELVGVNMGAIIGRRGETLDAIQQLTNYSVNRGLDKRTRIYIDAENYRKKREETLVRLAHKTAEKVIRYRKNMGLEPMNAYERHVIHAALQDTPGVTTFSSGTEPNRRVFVAYDRAKQGSGHSQSRSPRPVSSHSTPPSAPSVTDATEKPTHREWA